MMSIESIEAEIRKTRLGKETFFPLAEFPWTRRLETAWPAIRGELDRVLAAVDLLPGFEEVQKEQVAISSDKRWKMFPLFVYGHWLNSNVRRCPETVQALANIPGLQAAMFSILQPGKELPVHRGPYAGVLRYHLGLKVPKPETLCGIRVGEDSRHWGEAQSLIFDDSHEHTAWNHSEESRVVLFVDFTRPLPAPIGALNEAFISSFKHSRFIQDAISAWETWEGAFGGDLDRLLQSEAGAVSAS